jgi:hypothetical protein
LVAFAERRSLPAHPLADVIQPASGKATSCGTDKVCSGTDVPFDHDGRHIRPKANLPAGARIQITLGAKLLGMELRSHPQAWRRKACALPPARR